MCQNFKSLPASFLSEMTVILKPSKFLHDDFLKLLPIYPTFFKKKLDNFRKKSDDQYAILSKFRLKTPITPWNTLLYNRFLFYLFQIEHIYTDVCDRMQDPQTGLLLTLPCSSKG